MHANAIDVVTGKTYSMDMYLRTLPINLDHPIWGGYQMPPLTVSFFIFVYYSVHKKQQIIKETLFGGQTCIIRLCVDLR